VKKDNDNRIVFFVRSPGYLRVYASTFRALAKRGYNICTIFDPREMSEEARTYLHGLKKDWPWFTYESGFRRGGVWKRILRLTRNMMNYRRFLIVKEQSRFYRDHWLKFISPIIARLIKVFPLTDRLIATKAFGSLLKGITARAPLEPKIVLQLKRLDPLAVVVGFRNQPSAAPDLEYLATAKELSVPTIIPTPSWDMLSSKGLIEVEPDKLLVWNKEHKEQGMLHHGIRAERIKIVGAYQFDDWFDFKTITQERAEFCKAHGLDASKPILLYLGSGPTTGDGVPVAKELREWLDASDDPRVREVQLIIRPSPTHGAQYESLMLHDTAVVPRVALAQNDPNSKKLLFDSIYHSFATCTLHTTAIIDAMIHGKPGIVILHERFASVQKAQHFQELVTSGAVYQSHNAAELSDVLKELIAGKDLKFKARNEYLSKSLRPQGLEKNVGEIVAEEIVETISTFGKA